MAKKIKAATIAEVVIALTIIAICFAIAAKAFMQSSRSATEFAMLIEETEFQGQVFSSLLRDTNSFNDATFELLDIHIEKTEADGYEQQRIVLESHDKVRWKQDIYVEK